MTCSLHEAILPKGRGVSVNGVTIPRDLIAREVQYHPSRAPFEILESRRAGAGGTRTAAAGGAPIGRFGKADRRRQWPPGNR